MNKKAGEKRLVSEAVKVMMMQKRRQKEKKQNGMAMYERSRAHQYPVEMCSARKEGKMP
jgi:hypothetical protein